MKLEVYLASPRGFCAGVERAIAIVEKAINKFGSPIYVRHEIVHNKTVVKTLQAKGAIFVSEVEEVPQGGIVVFSAHGVARKVEQEAVDLNLKIFDATCPLVTKVHLEAQIHEKKGRKIILIGHAGHPEVEGTSGRVDGQVVLVSSVGDIKELKFTQDEELAYVTQTTLSVDDTREIIERLKEKYPKINGPELKDICYATQNRQNATKEMSKIVDMILVIGADNSSNSNRLRDIGIQMGRKSYLVNGYQDIKLDWFKDVVKIGVTAGASAPENLVQEVVIFLQKHFDVKVNHLNVLHPN